MIIIKIQKYKTCFNIYLNASSPVSQIYNLWNQMFNFNNFNWRAQEGAMENSQRGKLTSRWLLSIQNEAHSNRVMYTFKPDTRFWCDACELAHWSFSHGSYCEETKHLQDGMAMYSITWWKDNNLSILSGITKCYSS